MSDSHSQPVVLANPCIHSGDPVVRPRLRRARSPQARLTHHLHSFVSEIVAGQLVQGPASAAKDGREQGVLDVVKRNHKAFKLAAYGASSRI